MSERDGRILHAVPAIPQVPSLDVAPDDVLVDVARRTAEALSVGECHLYEYLPEQGELVAVALWPRPAGEEAASSAVPRITLAEQPTYAAVVLDGAVREDRLDDPCLSPLNRDLMVRGGEKSSIHVPLMQQHRVIGVMTLVERRRVRRFSEEEKRLLALLAVPAAVAVHNERLLREQRQRTRELSSLLDSIRAMASSESDQDVLEVVAGRSVEALDVACAVVYEYRDDDGMLMTRAVCSRSSVSGERWQGVPYAPADLLVDAGALRRGEIVEQLVSDLRGEVSARWTIMAFGERSRLSVPLLFRGEVMGMLDLIETRSERRFTEAERQLALGLGEQAGAALHNASSFSRQREQNRLLSVLLEASRIVAASDGVDQALDAVARTAMEALGGRVCEITSCDAEVATLTVRGIAGRPGAVPAVAGGHGHVSPLRDHPSDLAIIRGAVPVERHLSDPEVAPDERRVLAVRSAGSVLSVPLVLLGRPIGLLRLFDVGAGRHFTEEEVELARGLAEQAAVALESARRDEEAHQLTVELESQVQVRQSLLTLSEELLSLTDQTAVLRKIADFLRRMVAYESMQIWLLDEATQELVEVYMGDGGANLTQGRRTPCEEGIAGAVMRSGRAELARRVLPVDHAGRAAGGGERQTSIVAPLQVGGRPIGVLLLSRFGGRSFMQRELELAKLVVNLAAIAIWNSRLFGEMQEKAIRDGLTGLYNHRHFWERLAQEVARSRRYGTSLSLLMVDIDNFKLYNDARGHLAGDRVLEELASILQAQVRRDIDIVARYGGEEFTVLLPNTSCDGVGIDADTEAGEETGENRRAGGGRRKRDLPPPLPGGAQAVAERIREEVADRLAHTEDGPPLTVSIGVACLPECADDGLHLVQNADKALYLAKHLGKNRVEVLRPADDQRVE